MSRAPKVDETSQLIGSKAGSPGVTDDAPQEHWAASPLLDRVTCGLSSTLHAHARGLKNYTPMTPMMHAAWYVEDAVCA